MDPEDEGSSSTAPTSPQAEVVPKVDSAEDFMKDGKVIVVLKNVGNAPALKSNKFKLSVQSPFQSITDFLRKQLKYKPTDTLFLFINSTFQPSPDETVADLFKCFHQNGKLVVSYCTTAAWG